MAGRVDKHGLQVSAELANFIDDQALAGTGVSEDQFWEGLSKIVHELGPKNRELLATRETLQAKIDDWHIAHRGQEFDGAAYEAFLREIDYLLPEGPDFSIDTANVDPEIATIAGPQLVVPITNARYALNAANARWGSFYDALYGTDALGDLPTGKGYDPERGARVVARAKKHLDASAPLAGGDWSGVTALRVEGGMLLVENQVGETGLADPSQFVGSRDNGAKILLKKNGLHLEIVIDPSSPIGKTDLAGISDVRLESAMSAIMDCEDSVATVDAEEKVQAYSNWLGLMRGDLREDITKGGKTFTRELNPDVVYTTPDGGELTLKTRD